MIQDTEKGWTLGPLLSTDPEVRVIWVCNVDRASRNVHGSFRVDIEEVGRQGFSVFRARDHRELSFLFIAEKQKEVE